MNSRRFKCSVRLAAAVFGIAILSERVSADTIQLSVPAGTTNSLASVLAAQAPAYNDTDGGVSLGANDIEVSGPGVLEFSKALGSWTGNLTVKAGGIVCAVIGETTVLGNASTGAVFVEAGGTVRSDDSDNGGYGNAKAIARTINIAGRGAPGEYGALRLYPCNTSLRSCVPTKVVLTADATISFCWVNKAEYQFVSESKTFDLAGHTLTMTGAGEPKLDLWSFPRFFYSGTYVLNPGRIVHDFTLCECRSLANFAGDASNELVLTNNARLNLDGSAGGMMANGWTLVVDKTADGQFVIEPRARTAETTSAVYPGPVSLGRSLAYDENDRKFNDSRTNAFGFAGTITGPGGLSVSSPRTRDLNYFNLNSAANAFKGGFAATNFTVRLGAPTAVPASADAGALSLKDCDVLLNYAAADAADYAFPATVFDGSGSIAGKTDMVPVGSFATLFKAGAGTLALGVSGSFGSLALNEGTVAYRCGRSSIIGAIVGKGPVISGVYESPFKKTGIDSKFSPDMAVYQFACSVLYTNGVSSSIQDVFYTPHGVDTVKPASDSADFDSWNGWANPVASGWQKTFQSRILTGAGYLWNGSSEAKTIRVICTLNAYICLKIGGTEIKLPESGEIHRYHPGTVKDRTAATWEYESSTPKSPWGDFTVTLPPGATRVEARVWDRFGTTDSKCRLCYGNICTNGLANWRDDRGLMWTEKLDSKDMNDYHMFADEGDGKLTTEGDFAALAAKLRIGTLSGQGGTLDLDGLDIGVSAIEGLPRIAHGSVSVAGPWTLTAADVMGGTPLESVNLADCTQIAMTAEEVAKLVREPHAATEYVLAKNASVAVPVSEALAAKRWQTVLKTNGDLVLQRLPPGFIMIFR